MPSEEAVQAMKEIVSFLAKKEYAELTPENSWTGNPKDPKRTWIKFYTMGSISLWPVDKWGLVGGYSLHWGQRLRLFFSDPVIIFDQGGEYDLLLLAEKIKNWRAKISTFAPGTKPNPGCALSPTGTGRPPKKIDETSSAPKLVNHPRPIHNKPRLFKKLPDRDSSGESGKE